MRGVRFSVLSLRDRNEIEADIAYNINSPNKKKKKKKSRKSERASERMRVYKRSKGGKKSKWLMNDATKRFVRLAF